MKIGRKKTLLVESSCLLRSLVPYRSYTFLSFVHVWLWYGKRRCLAPNVTFHGEKLFLLVNTKNAYVDVFIPELSGIVLNPCIVIVRAAKT